MNKGFYSIPKNRTYEAPTSASYAATASTAVSSSYASTASFANSSSYASTASYALNAGSGGVGGSGSVSYIPIWSGSTTLGDSILFQNTSNYIGLNTTNPLSNLHIYDSGISSFLLESAGNTSFSEISVRNNNSTATSYFRQYGTLAAGTDFGVSRNNLATFFSNFASNFAIGTQNGGDLILGANNTERIRILSSSAAINVTGSLTVSGSGRFTNGLTVTGSFTVITGSSVELQVTNTGVGIGNIITDIHNVTGSFRVSGSITGSLFGTSSWATNALTASFLPLGTYSITSSWAVSASRAITASHALTAIVFPFTGSAIISGSLTVTGSTNLLGSTGTIFSTNADTLIITGSFITTGSASITGSLNVSAGITGSLFGTASWATNFVSASNYVLNSQTSSFATTGSNTFRGDQYISSSTNAANFTSTASLYTDGGLRVTRDAYVSGTLYTNNLTVFGTQSVQYITSSQLDISTNIITVNTATPSIRFGGLAVYDSGSTGTGRTGSILWDSQNDVWIYSNPSGALYDGALLLAGPRNTSGLGNEVGINVGYAAIGDGSHHMTSSQIYNSGSLIRLETDTQVTGSLNVSTGITGSLFGTASWANNAITASFVQTAQTSSYVLNAVSASFASTAALAPNYVLTSATSSMLTPYVLTSQTSSMTVATASFVTSSGVFGPSGANSILSASYALTASFALNAGGATVNTASLLTTASAVSNVITFTKGDASTFTVTVATGSGGLVTQIATGSVTASVTPTQFSVVSGSSTELVVGGTGVTIGSVVTDIHTVTGSLRVSGSITGSLLGTASFALTAGTGGSGGVSLGQVVAVYTGISNLF